MSEDNVAAWKQAKVKELYDAIVSKPVIGIVNVSGIPGPQLQDMRRMLRGSAYFTVTKNNFITLALKQAGSQRPQLEKLVDCMGLQNAIVATDMNPFKLYKQMDGTKAPSPAKGGEIAPDDIEVKAGETPFPPGPIVGELQKSGIPAAIEKGKVVIKKDKVLVEKGQKIPQEVAKTLTRLEIYPLTVGLDLIAAYEDGTIFGKDVLAIDDEAFMGEFRGAVSGAFNLACFIGYTTPFTIKPLLQKAHSDAMNVAVFAGITSPDTIKILLSKAHSQMLSLASKVSDGLDDELKAALSAQPKPSGGGGGAGAAPGKKEEKKEEPEEKVSEEEAAAGLGALFG